MIVTDEPITSPCYLSRLPLNLRDRRVQRDLGNSQALHRRLLDAFPGVTSRESVNLLYRLEARRSGQVPDYFLLVQSTAEPDWSVVDAGYLGEGERESGGLLTGGAEVKLVRQQLESITASLQFRFRLRANPTRKRHFKDGDVDEEGKARRPTGPNGTRIPLIEDAELGEWLRRKGSQHGFRVLGARWQPDAITGDRQRGVKANATRLTHAAIVFDGALEVTDRAEFLNALMHGVGSAKAYGFGLLSIASTGSR